MKHNTMKHIITTALAILALGGLMALNATAADEAKPENATEKKVDGLLAHWNFDESGENDVCADASGNGYEATPSAAIMRGTGKFGTHCVSLAGGQVLKVSDKMPALSASPMSLSVWVKPNTLEGRLYFFTYVPNTRETRGQYEYALHFDKGGEPRFWVWGHVVKGDEQEKWGLVCTTKLTVNEWSHVAITVGGPTGEPKKPSKKEGAVNLTYTMYLNGEVVASDIYPVPPYLPNLAYSIGGKPSGENGMDGDLDELMVFNKALTAEEVKSLFANNALPEMEASSK